jgi:hypothetical protein
MEELPDTVVSNILLNSSKEQLNSLLRTSTKLANSVNKVTEGDYIWRLMTESYLGVNIPYTSDYAIDVNSDYTWKDVYKFVTLIGKRKKLLFFRDVFHAKLGLLVVDLSLSLNDRLLKHVIHKGQLNTIAFLLTLPELYEDWGGSKYALLALKRRRQDVCMLLINDGRALRSSKRISRLILSSVSYGCDEVFLYLVDMYPNNITNELGDYYITACSYGYDDVADKIIELGIDASDDTDIALGSDMLDYLDGYQISANLKYGVQASDICAMITSGYVLEACELLEVSGKRVNTKDLNDTICIAIMNGIIDDVSDLICLINKRHIDLHAIIEKLVVYPNTNVNVIKQLLELRPLDTYNDVTLIQLSKRALKYGNWQFSEAILAKR